MTTTCEVLWLSISSPGHREIVEATPRQLAVTLTALCCRPRSEVTWPIPGAS